LKLYIENYFADFKLYLKNVLKKEIEVT